MRSALLPLRGNGQLEGEKEKKKKKETEETRDLALFASHCLSNICRRQSLRNKTGSTRSPEDRRLELVLTRLPVNEHSRASQFNVPDNFRLFYRPSAASPPRLLFQGYFISKHREFYHLINRLRKAGSWKEIRRRRMISTIIGR